MPYVSRGSDGRIAAVSDQAMLGCNENIDQNDQELADFLSDIGNEPDVEKSAHFIRSDLDFIRVMEDLINVLIDKHIICFTDLPSIAQEKITHRRKIRASFSKEMNLLDDDDALI